MNPQDTVKTQFLDWIWRLWSVFNMIYTDSGWAVVCQLGHSWRWFFTKNMSKWQKAYKYTKRAVICFIGTEQQYFLNTFSRLLVQFPNFRRPGHNQIHSTFSPQTSVGTPCSNEQKQTVVLSNTHRRGLLGEFSVEAVGEALDQCVSTSHHHTAIQTLEDSRSAMENLFYTKTEHTSA